MGDRTAIQWTDATWNPVTGCEKVSKGCRECYAKRIHDLRHKAHQSGKAVPKQYATPFESVVLHPDRLMQPLRWREPRRIFVNSMSDLFHESVSVPFLDSCFAVMALAEQHTFQILTKRPERMRNYFDLSYVSDLPLADILADISSEARIAKAATRIAEQRREDTSSPYWDLFLEQPYHNVWLGVSVEDQKTADERIPLLLQTPAAVRFVSYEPALGPVDFSRCIPCGYYCDESVGHVDHGPNGNLECIDWIIAGGESGPNARPSNPDWFRSVRDQCIESGVPFFFKQWGEWRPDGNPVAATVKMERAGKRSAGRLLDGREWNEFPATA